MMKSAPAHLGYSLNCECICCTALKAYYHGNDDAWSWSLEGLKWFRGYAAALVIAEVWAPETADYFMDEVLERIEDSAASMKAISWERWMTRK